VTLRYRLAALPGREQRIACRFAANGGGELVGLRTDREGELAPPALFFLKAYALSRPPAAATAGPFPYLVQQIANAVTPAAIYALLATGYALIYGVTGRINLAFGDFTTVGAVAAVNGLTLGAAGIAALLPLATPLALALAIVAGGALGSVLHALVIGPLRQRGSQALLIATIGLAIALSEGLRLATHSRQTWLPPFLDQPMVLLDRSDGTVALSLGQALLALLAALAVAAVILLLRWSAFGRSYRACADDAEAAALVGVDVDRTLRDACVLGSAVAGIAGFVVAARYGIVAFGMGSLWGFKALAAAIIGGIGSVGGAACGGVLIGVLEGLWAGYLPGAYRDVALFALLALMLALRPHGLLGHPEAADNPALWRRRFYP
jgi:branched-chain amino acid transport system permease protein